MIVDDVIITSNNNPFINSLISSLNSKFALKDLGLLNYFMGIQMTYLPHGLHLHQAKYIGNLFARLNIETYVEKSAYQKSFPLPQLYSEKQNPTTQ